MAQDNSQLDPADTMAMIFMGMLILGSGAGATLAARFLTPVQQALHAPRGGPHGPRASWGDFSPV